MFSRSPVVERTHRGWGRPGHRLLVLVVLVASLLVVGPTAGAAARPQVLLVRSSATILSTDSVSLTARVSAASRGSRVVLQRLRGRTWVTARRLELHPHRDVVFVRHPADGVRQFRALVRGGSGRLLAVSSPVSVHVLTCAPALPPPSGMGTAFSRPHTRGTTPVARRLAGLFCAAAPFARVHISMYFIRAVNGGPDVRLILGALRRVVRYHHVRVGIVLEGRLYRRGRSLSSSMRPLKAFATIHRCDAGCHNERPGRDEGGSPSIMHNKFVTISDMAWKRRVDPTVVVASGNWSDSQLRQHWTSAVDIYDDVRLTQQFDTEWMTLAICADRGCAAVPSYLEQAALPSGDHSLGLVNGLWRDVPIRERHGDEGRGTSAIFSPWMRRDPIARRLSEMTCTPAHHTVRLGQMFVTGARSDLLNTLVALQAGGCHVQLVLAQPGGALQWQGVRLARSLGLDPLCVQHVHEKLTLVDAVRRGSPVHSLWTGSQSLGGNALHSNDESLLHLSDASSQVSSIAAIGKVFDAYSRQWSALSKQSETCRPSTDPELAEVANSLTADPHDHVMPQ